jgi:hypothetical protein
MSLTWSESLLQLQNKGIITGFALITVRPCSAGKLGLDPNKQQASTKAHGVPSCTNSMRGLASPTRPLPPGTRTTAASNWRFSSRVCAGRLPARSVYLIQAGQIIRVNTLACMQSSIVYVVDGLCASYMLQPVLPQSAVNHVASCRSPAVDEVMQVSDAHVALHAGIHTALHAGMHASVHAGLLFRPGRSFCRFRPAHSQQHQ